MTLSADFLRTGLWCRFKHRGNGMRSGFLKLVTISDLDQYELKDSTGIHYFYETSVSEIEECSQEKAQHHEV